jgi:hypothetical protein
MIFKINFWLRNTAYALFALASLAAYSQSPTPETHGIVVAKMDRSVKPGDDFFHYANGDWIKHAEIPADRSYVGTWDTLEDMSRKHTAGLIEEAAKASVRVAHSSTRSLPLATNMTWHGLWARASGLTSMP